MDLKSQHYLCAGEAAYGNRPWEDDKVFFPFCFPLGYLKAQRPKVCYEVLAFHFRKQASGREKQ